MEGAETGEATHPRDHPRGLSGPEDIGGDLVETAVKETREAATKLVRERALDAVEERLLDALLPPARRVVPFDAPDSSSAPAAENTEVSATRQKPATNSSQFFNRLSCVMRRGAFNVSL